MSPAKVARCITSSTCVPILRISSSSTCGAKQIVSASCKAKAISTVCGSTGAPLPSSSRHRPKPPTPRHRGICSTTCLKVDGTVPPSLRKQSEAPPSPCEGTDVPRNQPVHLEQKPVHRRNAAPHHPSSPFFSVLMHHETSPGEAVTQSMARWSSGRFARSNSHPVAASRRRKGCTIVRSHPSWSSPPKHVKQNANIRQNASTQTGNERDAHTVQGCALCLQVLSQSMSWHDTEERLPLKSICHTTIARKKVASWRRNTTPDTRLRAIRVLTNLSAVT